MKMLLGLILLSNLNALALESDNYLMWNRELKDSGREINSYIIDQIQTALMISNRKVKIQTCEQVTAQIASRFKTFLVHDNPLENWLMKNLSSDQIYPRTLNYLPQSIYRDPFRFYIPAFGLAPNVQVNNFYFGTDKLSHFSSTGSTYFKIYLQSLRKGRSKHQAKIDAIHFGLRDEATLHGYWASGVFSYGDLESNYQGFLFFRRLCSDDQDNYLEFEDGHWVLKHEPDIADYVDGNWDESFYPSHLLTENWKKVSVALKTYCTISHDPAVLERFAYYHATKHESFSQSYIEALHSGSNPRVPNPEKEQSFSDLCR